MTGTETRPAPVVPCPAKGFGDGYTAVFGERDPGGPGLDFGIRRLAAGQLLEEEHPKESAWVLLQGKAELRFASQKARASRSSLFEEAASALLVCPETAVAIRSVSATEWAVLRAVGQADYPPAFFRAESVKPEYRGEGLVQGACLCCHRTIVHPSSHEDAGMTISELVTYPGRWSCYPPQHHDQPELHHYRFTLPQGFGLAQAGGDVVRVRHGDTLRIPPGGDHTQAAAPGYGMYALCVMRNLPGNPYSGSRVLKEHSWLLDPGQQGWLPPAPQKAAPDKAPRPKRA